MRKIVQIAADAGGITALCDDGSLWWMGDGVTGWYRLPDIPQDEPAQNGEAG